MREHITYLMLTKHSSEQSRRDCEIIANLGLKAKILTHVRCNMEDARLAVETGVDGVDVVVCTLSVHMTAYLLIIVSTHRLEHPPILRNTLMARIYPISSRPPSRLSSVYPAYFRDLKLINPKVTLRARGRRSDSAPRTAFGATLSICSAFTVP